MKRLFVYIKSIYTIQLHYNVKLIKKKKKKSTNTVFNIIFFYFLFFPHPTKTFPHNNMSIPSQIDTGNKKNIYIPDENSWASEGSSSRNKDEIAQVLRPYISTSDRVFEIASGFGVHATHFAEVYKDDAVQFTPSEAQPKLIELIEKRVNESPFKEKIDTPILFNLDDDQSIERFINEYKLGKRGPSYDGIVVINLLHISPLRITEKLFSFAERLLLTNEKENKKENSNNEKINKKKRPKWIAIYGPFKKTSTEFHSQSDEKFEESLKSRNKAWGLRVIDKEVVPFAQAHSFGNTTQCEVHPMNKGNFILVFKRDT